MNSEKVTEIKNRIKEAQRRLKLIEDKLESTNGKEAERWAKAYPKVVEKMEGLCCDLQNLVGWKSTCPWGCYACLEWEKTPLEVFEEQGYLLLWSESLRAKVAFAKDWAKDRVPQGYVIYTEDELRKLFLGNHDCKPNTLKLIHEVKKYGAKVTEVEVKTRL